MLYAAKLEGKPVKEVNEEPVVVLEKKPRTEKQIAATLKAAETRKRKREEKEETARLEMESKQQAVAKEEQLQKAEKKAQQAEKRRLAKQAKLTAESISTEASEVKVETMVEEPVHKAVQTSHDPPSWFLKYVEGVKQTENQVSQKKKPRKVIKQESHVEAGKSWSQPIVRDKIRNETDQHMSRMYKQIFGR
jgi:hypothetical protein